MTHTPWTFGREYVRDKYLNRINLLDFTLVIDIFYIGDGIANMIMFIPFNTGPDYCIIVLFCLALSQ